ncbi:MAG TPA: protein kinase [Kofleriaceae bacterium]|nr:protein kinase [Kofleriaceae bacterium]
MEDDKWPTISDGPPSFDDDRAAALIGTDVGGYVIESELGRGGMGVVFAATHPMIGKRVAIKVLRPSLSKNPATVERFVQEARAVNQIGHPNIVDIFAFGALPDGRSYLIMDLLIGESLRKRVKRGKVPIDDATKIIDEVASALMAAHAKGFIHRDLKPDNIYLVDHPSRFDVKLLDFGLAKLLPSASPARAFRTATGAQLGTPDYMSPEQLRGTGVDHRTDIYALGVLSFEILARERPRRYSNGTFELAGLTVSQALVQRHAVPEQLAELIEAMVANSPDDRPSFEAVRTVIKRVRTANDGIRAVGTGPSMGTMSPSMVGARPVVTPLSGTPTLQVGRDVSSDAISLPPALEDPAYPSEEPAPYTSYSQPPYSQSPYASRPPSQGPSYVPPPLSGSVTSPALAKSVHPSTKLGVAPPPERPSNKHPVAAARRNDSRLWLFVGLALVVVAGIALIVVLAS